MARAGRGERAGSSAPGKGVDTVTTRSVPNMYEDMPASSDDLQVPIEDLDALLAVYGSLRSFSFLFRLSPAPLHLLCSELNQTRMSSLIDEIAVQVMKVIHDFPPELDGDTVEESAVKYTGDPDYAYMISAEMHKVISDPIWKFLDNMTWPEFMRRLMVAAKFSARGGVDVIEWIGKKEWYQLPLSAKIESLRFLVDLVCTSPVARSHIDGLEEQLRSCYASEKEEIAAKKKIMTKLARNKAGSGKSGGGADSDSDSDDGKDGTVPAEFDHLFVRDDTQLQHMELDHCDICLQGGKLVLCDGCPAAYRKESVGLKRVSDDKWFCEECRIGGQIRTYRYLHRYAEAVEWEGLPPVSSFGVNPEGLDVSIAYGRIYVGYEGRLLAYYSDIERLHAFMAWMAKGEEMPKKDEDRALKAGTKVGQKSNVGGGLAKKGEGPAPDEDSERGVSSSRSKRKSRSEEALMQLDGAHEEGALPQLDGAGGGRSSRSRVQEEEHAQDEDDEEADETPKKSARAKGGSAKKGSKDNLDKGDDDGSSTKKKGGSAKKGHGGSSSKKSRKAGDLDNKNDGDEGQDEEDEKEEDPKEEEEDELKSSSKRGRGRRSSKQVAVVEDEEDEMEDDSEEEDYDILSALKLKLKLIQEEMEFRQKVESKFDSQYYNRYKEGQSAMEVKLLWKKKKEDNSSEQKWKKWDLHQRDPLQAISSYLFRIERELRGLIDGQWLTPSGRTNWTELVKNANDVSDLSIAAVELETALKSVAMNPTWYTSQEASAKKKKRPGRRKKSEVEEKKPEYDLKEMKLAGLYEDPSIYAEEDKEEEEEARVEYCWISGNRAAPCSISLSTRSIRNCVLSAGELEMQSFVYTGEHASPAARLRWVAGCLDAGSTAQLAICLRSLHDIIRWDKLKRPAAPTEDGPFVDENDEPIPEKALNKRDRYGLQYLLQYYGSSERVWVQMDKVPLYIIADYESEVRRNEKKYWWKAFDFHPGAALEVRFGMAGDSSEWYQVFVLETLEELPKDISGLEFDPKLFKPDVGMVLVHYIGGREDEDEWIPKDSDRLRVDKYRQRQEAQYALWYQQHQRMLSQVSDPAQRKALSLELKADRKRKKEAAKISKQERLALREAEKERKAQEKLERLTNRQLEKSERERLRQELKQERIALRQKEQERKRLESKKSKELEIERRRILQSKASWWKEFDWIPGVMVEMEWDGEWWDAIVVQTIGCNSQTAQVAPVPLAPSKTEAAATAEGEGADDLPMFSAEGDLPMFEGESSTVPRDGAEGYYDTYTGEDEGTEGGKKVRKGFKRTPATILEVRVNKEAQALISKFLETIMLMEEAKPFLNPVPKKIAAEYEKVVKHPMDFSQVKEKQDKWKYGAAKTFLQDCKTIFENAKLFYKQDDNVYKQAEAVENEFEKLWKDVEKELQRIAEERCVLIAKDENPELDPKAWLKNIHDSPAKSVPEGGVAPAPADGAPPPPPPPSARQGSPSPPPPPVQPNADDNQAEMQIDDAPAPAPVNGFDEHLAAPSGIAQTSALVSAQPPTAMQIDQHPDAASDKVTSDQGGMPESAEAMGAATGATESSGLEKGGGNGIAGDESGLTGGMATPAGIGSDATDPTAWLRAEAVASPQKPNGELTSPSKRAAVQLDPDLADALLPYTVAQTPGPKLLFPPGWPEDSVFYCAEDDRPLDVARKYRVNLERLVRMNRKTYSGLTKTSPLKAGTALKLPLPMDIGIESDPPPPPDPMKVGVVLVHYVGGSEEETEWVYTCSKRMRLSADKLWNAVAVEAAQEMENLLAADPDAWKKHSEKVLKRIKKNQQSWPFWEPFWNEKGEAGEEVEAPDYLQIIKEPMCLDMVEELLAQDKFESPDEFVKYMTLIFENAKVYNPPEHDFHHKAQKMLELFDEAWKRGHEGNNWGQEFGKCVSLDMLKDTDRIRPSSGKKKGGNKTPGKEGDEAERIRAPRTPKTILEVTLVKHTKAMLGKLLEKMMAMDEAKFFLTPVTPDIAPDYTDVIKHPMDLQQVKEKLEGHKYQISKTFIKDVKLVFENALAYNDKKDVVHKNALKLQKHFDKEWKAVESQLEEFQAERDAKEAEKERRRAGEEDDGEGGSAPKKKVKIEKRYVWQDKGGWAVVCPEVLEKLMNHEDAWPFLEPVDPKALKLKDYTTVIQSPMDLGTVKNRLDDERYDEKKMGEEFSRDVLLTFDNALLYNNEDDEIWKYANALKILFKDMWKDLNKAIENPDAEKAKTPKAPRAKTVHKGGWECELCDDGGRLILCDHCGRGWHAKCLEIESVKQLPDPWHCRECPGGPKFLWEQKGGWNVVCTDIIGKLLKNKRAWPFEQPVDTKALKLGDYKKIVKKPMDLGTIKTQLEDGKYALEDSVESAEEFHKDVVLTFDNALLYNNEGDDIWEAAASLKATFEEMWSKVNTKLERLKKVVPDPKTPGSSSSDRTDKVKTPTASSSQKKPQTEQEPPAVQYVWEKKGGWAVVCKEILEKLLKSKRVWPFEEPVDPKALKLSDYFKIVKKPMDLGTVGSKLEKGEYKNLDKSGKEFHSDVMLTFDNALLYNNQGDDIWEAAASLKAAFEELWAKMLEPVPAKAKSTDADSSKTSANPTTPVSAGKNEKGEDGGKKSAKKEKEEEQDPNHKGGWECEICDDGGKLILCDNCGRGWHQKCLHVTDIKALPDPWFCRECPGGPKFLWQQKGGWQVVCKEILDMLFKDPRVLPFERPVDPEEFGLKDYFKIIKKPMDLGTVDRKLRKGEYDKENLDTEFYADVSLVFGNAMKYNTKGDPVHELAADFKRIFEEAWAWNKEPLALNCAMASNSKKSAASKAKSAALAAAGKKSVASATTPAASKKAESGTTSSKKPGKSESQSKEAGPMFVWEKKGGWAVVCKDILAKLSKNKRAWMFETPVDPMALGLRDYFKIVKKPMDLGTVGSKLEKGEYKNLDKSGKEFHSDVMLTFDNALLYNPQGDDVWEAAASIKAAFEELWAKMLERLPAAAEDAKTPVSSKPAASGGKGQQANQDGKATGGAPGPLKPGQEHAVGTLVRMLFDDGVWYPGRVTKFEPRSKKYTVLFDDGETQETAIPDKDVQLVDAKDGSAKKAGAKRPQASPAPQGALKDGQEFPIGTRVRMLFDDAVWYPGSIVKYEPRSKKYVVEFEDGDKQETKIPDKDVEVLGEGEGKDGAESGKKAKRARASDANSHEPASDAPKNKPAAGASGEAVGGKRKRLSEGEGGGLHEDPEANLGRCVLYQGQTGTLIRYQQRQGKYRVKLEDGKEVDLVLPDDSVTLVPAGGDAAGNSKRGRK